MDSSPASLPVSGSPPPAAPGRQALRLLALVALVFLFLVAIQLMSSAFKALGRETAEALFAGIQNPFAGLAVGILATVLVQSSSVSTSTIVALVGSGQIGVSAAVPMVMGANIGTTVTNTLVSLGSIRRRAEFRRAFAAATVHDFFNLLTVAILLTAELLTGFLAKTAAALAGLVGVRSNGVEFSSPIKAVVKDVAHFVQGGLESLGITGNALSLVMLGVALALIFTALLTITRTMRLVIANRVEKAMNTALARSGLVAIGVGTLVTIAVQSSSITTSLLVPLCGSGILALRNAFPVMLGANIGTTITALLASLATDANGVTIALVHTLFNLTGVLLFYPVRPMREIPIHLAEGLARRAAQNRSWVLAYVLVVFLGIPGIGILLFK